MDSSPPTRVTEEFRRRSVHHLRDEYLPRLERACDRLTPEDLWWRPHAATTSVGNLLLHLEGNVRQWILCGLGGAPDHRQRDDEFRTREGASSGTLLASLRETVEAACTVVDGLDERALLRRHDIQVFEGISGLAAVLHVVEHFAWHTGQVAWITKLRTGEELGYYDDSELGRNDD